jgi:hypothetical protein
MGGTRRCHGRMRREYSLEGKRPLETHISRWRNDVKRGLKEVVWEGINSIHLA